MESPSSRPSSLSLLRPMGKLSAGTHKSGTDKLSCTFSLSPTLTQHQGDKGFHPDENMSFLSGESVSRVSYRKACYNADICKVRHTFQVTSISDTNASTSRVAKRDANYTRTQRGRSHKGTAGNENRVDGSYNEFEGVLHRV